MNSKYLILVLMATCGVILPVSPTAGADQVADGQPLIVVLPRRIDYDVLRTSVIDRVSELNNHKYWQATYVVGGVGLGALVWWKYFYAEKHDGGSASPDAVVTTEKKKRKQPEEVVSWTTKMLRGTAKDALRAFVLAIASALIVSGQKSLSKLFYWWKAPNKVALYSVLFTVAYNAFDGYMLRHKEGFLMTNTEVIKRYNRVLRCLQQYVVELASQTVFIAKKSGVSVDDSVDLLLAQFSRDVDAANKKIIESTEPFVDEAAMCGALLNLAIDSVGRLEDIYDGFLEDQSDEPVQKHTQLPYSQNSEKGKRRG